MKHNVTSCFLNLLSLLGNKLENRHEQLEAKYEQLEAKYQQLEAKYEQLEAKYQQLEAKCQQLEQLQLSPKSNQGHQHNPYNRTASLQLEQPQSNLRGNQYSSTAPFSITPRRNPNDVIISTSVQKQSKRLTSQAVTRGKNKYVYNDAYVKQLRSTSYCYNLNWESNSVYRYEQSRNEPIFLCAISRGDHAFIASEMEGYPNFYHLHPRNKLVVNNLGSNLDIFRFFFDFDEDTPASLPKYICHSWEPAVIEYREDRLFELYKKGKLLLVSGAKQ